MTLLRYWTTRSFCWTKTGLSLLPSRSWHNPSWIKCYVYLGWCPAHLLCPGRWGAQRAIFHLANRGGGVTMILILYTINTNNTPRWATPWAKATQSTWLVDTENHAVECFFHLLMFWNFCNLCVSRDFNVYFQFNISESTWVMGKWVKHPCLSKSRDVLPTS